jgi:hypothetical protein
MKMVHSVGEKDVRTVVESLMKPVFGTITGGWVRIQDDYLRPSVDLWAGTKDRRPVIAGYHKDSKFPR